MPQLFRLPIGVTESQANSPPEISSPQLAKQFAALFLATALLAAWGTTLLFSPTRSLTISVTTIMGKLLGLTVTSNGDIILVNGFAMEVADQCTSLNYTVILAMAMLLYRRHPLRYRLQGIVIATGVLLIANSLRLLTLGLAGPVSFRLFSILHENVWVAAFAVLVFTIWKIWADRRFSITKEMAKHILLAAPGFLAAVFLLIKFHDSYNRLLASLAVPMFKLMRGDITSTVIWNGVFSYQHRQDTLQVGLSTDEYTLPLYIGLLLPYVWRNVKAMPLALLGLLVILIINAAGVALLGEIGMVYGHAGGQMFMNISSVISLALPMALYRIITIIALKGPKRAHSPNLG